MQRSSIVVIVSLMIVVVGLCHCADIVQLRTNVPNLINDTIAYNQWFYFGITDISFDKVLTIDTETVASPAQEDLNGKAYGRVLPKIYIGLNVIPTNDKYDYSLSTPGSSSIAFYVSRSDEKTPSSTSNNSTKWYYIVIQGDTTNSKAQMVSGATGSFVLHVSVDDTVEMSEQTFIIIVALVAVVASLLVVVCVVPTGISLSVVAGVDFCACCSNRKKRGYHRVQESLEGVAPSGVSSTILQTNDLTPRFNQGYSE